MKRIMLLLACLVVMPPDLQASELFRWVDKAGKVNYGDTPPMDATGVERIKFSSQPAQNEDFPYETRRAMENFPVTLYVGDNCGEPCVQARSSLNKRGIPFSEKSLKTKQDIEAFKKLSGFDAFVPALAVGKNFLKGFEELQWNSELDIAGYPKIASYHQRTVMPSTPAEPENPPAEGQPSEGQPSEGQTSPAKPAEQ
jgi:hypothetical protein